MAEKLSAVYFGGWMSSFYGPMVLINLLPLILTEIERWIASQVDKVLSHLHLHPHPNPHHHFFFYVTFFLFVSSQLLVLLFHVSQQNALPSIRTLCLWLSRSLLLYILWGRTPLLLFLAALLLTFSGLTRLLVQFSCLATSVALAVNTRLRAALTPTSWDMQHFMPSPLRFAIGVVAVVFDVYNFFSPSCSWWYAPIPLLFVFFRLSVLFGNRSFVHSCSCVCVHECVFCVSVSMCAVSVCAGRSPGITCSASAT